ncbi:MAG TPA: hypothetical protein VN909_05015 [Candidatus Dormibacteraeota bacterium]|nr:hypothetical protein [Candidatus Dormibacteraeota bacterium]
MSLWHAMAHGFDLWFFGSGRFYPLLIVEKYVVFSIFTNLFAYKLLLVLATVAMIEVFRRCVAAYSSRSLANLAALIAVGLLVERGYHDPILSYNAMPQVVALLVLCSIMAFRHVLKGETGAWSVASIALYALAALTYEDAYGLALLYPLLATAARRTWRDVLRVSGPYLLIAAALTLFGLTARAIAHVPAYSPYGLNPAAGAVLRTVADQIGAALPLGYYLFDPSHIFSRNGFYDFYNNAPVQPLLFVAFALAAAFALADAASESVDVRPAIAAGAAVTILAAAPIALLVKYQSELRPGLGYLPVLYEELGLALVLAGLAVLTMRQTRRRWWQAGWVAAIAVVATIAQATNVRVVREGWAEMEARAVLERQLDDGLLKAVPENAFIATAPREWIAYDGQGPEGISSRGLFFLHGGSRVRLVAPSDPRAEIVLTYDPARRRWSLMRSGSERE